jgi:hypothetical protein
MPWPVNRSLILPLAVLVAPALALAQDAVREVDELTLRWTRLEQQRDALLADWRTAKPILEQQLSLLERETRELTELVEASTREQDEVEQRRLELLEEQTRLEQEQAALDRSLAQAVIVLRALHLQLPPPLVRAWEERLPELEDPLRTATEKLQLTIELLQQLDDFDQRITLNEVVMRLEDGSNHLVKQIYLGLSHGWYATEDGRYAASGMATPEGWRWMPMTDGQAVLQTVGILERRIEPTLVSIPLRLDGDAAVGGD